MSVFLAGMVRRVVVGTFVVVTGLRETGTVCAVVVVFPMQADDTHDALMALMRSTGLRLPYGIIPETLGCEEYAGGLGLTVEYVPQLAHGVLLAM